jgi:hypothetical protein
MARDDPATPLGALSLAGRSIAERQLDIVLALGCERVVCLADALDRQLLALQHRVEAAGGRFNLVSGARQLVGLVNANDELVAIADGLLPAASDTTKALGGGSGVLVLPVEAGIAAGFERVDLNHAWAGLLAMPGRLVERLAELPPDCDTIASLLRIALQGRVPERVLPEAVLDEGRWTLVRTRRQLTELEPGWFRRHAAAPNWLAPGQALARLGVQLFGGRLLKRGIRPGLLAGAGLLFAACGIASAWLGHAVLAVVLAGAGWLLAEAGSALATLASARADGEGRHARLASLTGVLLDFALLAVLVLSLGGELSARLFAPVVMVGLLRAGRQVIPEQWAGLLGDRMVLAALLGAGAAVGALLPAIEVLALVLVALLLGLAPLSRQLTQA